MDLCVRNGYVYTDGRIVEKDVGVRDGEIVEIGDIDDADRVLDADGNLVMPGLVNAHTHAAMTLFRGYADDLPLETWLREKIWPIEARLQPDDIYAGTRLAALEMIKSGTTSFGDMYFEMERVAEAVEEAGLRATLGYGMITENKETEDEKREELEGGVEFVREYDGAANGRVSAMLAPHAPYSCDDWFLEEAAEKADDLACVFHTHLSETQNEVENSVANTGVSPAWHLDNHGILGENVYVAHGVHLDHEEIELLRDRDVSVAHCPSANMKLASGAAPVDLMDSKGVNVAIGTDGAASNNNLDMFEETRRAALLSKVTESDAAAVPAKTAIEMATHNGGYALGTEAGVIERGRPADMIVVDVGSPHLTPHHDLISNLVYSAKGTDVVATVVDGEVVMEDREVLTLDEEKVKQDAIEASVRLDSEVAE
ncbi:MAG: amidohydrolase [Halobacteria archaeon]|nr:amidohydrolase [Halobacteria archaeon]